VTYIHAVGGWWLVVTSERRPTCRRAARLTRHSRRARIPCA
jgi:hypothetical protein